ncbi:DNA-binding transcriptional regulator, Lrp family [Halobiforma haloterrestris]|uniref:DNA-binding transcriptional regulator, Lrp family n=1 Tax=Natronobacterium haloterrestre TaxID=148448 RepID=A0A1I1DIT9_NATHA|nr:AsnC family transcriptional regulator [Halobiforma haloterrestris]SFB72630.1 DNA-binding transcriptional regulator, Lrp family [Halobiforma haloterrestris]
MVHNLDDVDRGILHLLQENARGATAADMAEMVGTSASTVRNRIEYLEEGVIRGYHPEIDYERAGFDLHLFVVCRAPVAKRTELARKALDLPGVINVRELTTGTHNVHVESVAVDSETADETLTGIEDLGLEIVSSQVIKEYHVQPFNHFGKDLFED